MEIVIAGITDIKDLAFVEIASKRASISQLINGQDIDAESRMYRWASWFRGESPQTSKPGRIAFKAIIDDTIVGYISGHLTMRYNCDAEIQSFYILKEHQGKGVGKRLFDHFIKWMEQQGAKSLCVGFDSNNPYQSFYIKQGGKYLNEHWIVWDEAV